MKKLTVALTAMATLFVLAGCGGATGSGIKGPEVDTSKMNRPELIDYPGSALGAEIPAWVVAVADGDAKKIRKSLDLDENTVIFPITNKGSNLDFLKAWSDQVESREEVASSIKQNVARIVQQEMEGKSSDEATIQKAINTYGTSNTNITVNGLQKVAQYWIQTRTLKAGLKSAQNGDSDYTYEYTYYVVYAMEKSLFDSQMKAAMDNVDDNDTEIQFLKEVVTMKMAEKYDLLSENEVDDVDFSNVKVESIE